VQDRGAMNGQNDKTQRFGELLKRALRKISLHIVKHT
jgi:hypothetical protein